MKKVFFLLGELDDDDIDWMISTGHREEVVAGTVLIQEGQAIDTLHILLEGTLSVSVAALEGKTIARLTSGAVVGEMSFADARPPSATVQAVENSLVLSIRRADLIDKLQKDEGFASRFYRAIAIFCLLDCVVQSDISAMPKVSYSAKIAAQRIYRLK
jgi:CRP-like cAMP-binding protein